MEEQKRYDAGITLSEKVESFIQQQKTSWPLAQKNYAGLEKVESKDFHFDGFKITVQFNLERIRSSAAKTDTKSIQARACFLCGRNRPKEQLGIDFMNKYTILINPYPIFPKHLTIPFNEHQPQEIKPYFADMLKLSMELPEFIIFYNGAKCGASAPDHFHFQAGSKKIMPVDTELNCITEKFGEQLFQNEKIIITAIGENYLRKFILLKSYSEKELVQHFQNILNLLKERGQEGEPMMNILANYNSGYWNVLLFPRDNQRPKQFFANADEQILISPASVELGGLAILPRKEDFDKLTKTDLQDIYTQVTINNHDFEQLKKKIKISL